MGTCTMIFPSIFAIIHFIDVPTFPSIDTWPLAVVALLLPLSTLWTTMEPNPTFDILKAWSNQSSEELFTNNGHESLSCKNFSQNLKFGFGKNKTNKYNIEEINSINYTKTAAKKHSSISRDSSKGYLWKSDERLDRRNGSHNEKN
ncbi:hypothetical protein EV44_g0236 [Erysiphe necator]|uniref:Uncharacterized protein n=1 Tax=Uncinula necator TaxID=52586 RepID=A0A0B1P9N6_UNCNE|nr:hypothetical protein EV44_g0236 [Erysiphe necator]